MSKLKKEIIIDLSAERSLYGFYLLLIKKLELPDYTGLTLDGMSDFLREPWEEDRNVEFINASKASKAVRSRMNGVTEMFEYVKKFQKQCGNEFTWSIEY